MAANHPTKIKARPNTTPRLIPTRPGTRRVAPNQAPTRATPTQARGWPCRFLGSRTKRFDLPDGGHPRIVNDPTTEETIHKFETAGFVLKLEQLGTGRYLADATDMRRGTLGPVGVADTPDQAASAAWRRFEENRHSYLDSSEDSST